MKPLYLSVISFLTTLVLLCSFGAAVPLAMQSEGNLSVSAAASASSVTDSQLQQMADQVAAIVNQERVAEGLEPLPVVPLINAAASVRAEELTESYSHTRPNGEKGMRILKTDAYQIDYDSAGENIAHGQESPEEVMEDWMGSAGHRQNIFGEKHAYNYMGVGVAQDAKGELYWVQLFVEIDATYSDAYLPEYQVPATTTTTAVTTTTTAATTTTTTITQATTTANDEFNGYLTLENLNLKKGEGITVLLRESGEDDSFFCAWHFDEEHSIAGTCYDTFDGDSYSLSIRATQDIGTLKIYVSAPCQKVWISTYVIFSPVVVTTAPTETTTTTTATTTEETTTTETTTTTTTTTTEPTTTTEIATTTTTAETTTTTEATSTTTTTDPMETAKLYGDVNLDGRVELSDAVLLSKAVADVVLLPDLARENADCNGDGEVSGQDTIVLLRFLVNLIPALPESSER